MIEEANRDETKNQVGASPEPDVLMKYVQYDDGNNEQGLFHCGAQNLASAFDECQAFCAKTLRQDLHDSHVNRVILPKL